MTTLRVTSLAMALCATALGSAQINIPGGQKIDIGLPSLGDILRGEAPLTTSMKNVKVQGFAPLDGYEPKAFIPLTDKDRNAKGKFVLKPGAYQITLQTFCLRGYTYGPTKGLGYAWGPWKGSKAKLIRDLIYRYSLDPEVKQQDMQSLLWAILARVKPQDMRGGAQVAMLQLMGKDGGKALADGALEYFSAEAERKIYEKASKELRPFLEFDNKMRGMVRDANTTYDQMERLAVLPSPADTLIEIPEARWNLSPGGFAFRIHPVQYSHSVFQVVVPFKRKFDRDSLGRVVRISRPDGFVLEFTYDEAIKPWKCETDPGLTAYAIKQVKSITPEETKEVAVKMWVFKGIPKNKPRKRAAMSEPTVWLRLLTREPVSFQSNWFERWQDRAERIEETRERLEEYNDWRERFEDIESGRGEGGLNDVVDSEHIHDGLEAATTGDTSDRVGWIADTHGSLLEELARAIGVLNTLPDGSSEVDPNDGIHVPGAGGHQLIGSSSRGY